MPVAYVSLWKTSENFHTSVHSKLNGASESLRHPLNSFVVFCATMWPYVLPPLFAIALEAPLSLRTWIAVQRTPPPRLTESSPRVTRLQKIRKRGLTHLAPVYLLCVALLASYLQCVARVSLDDLRVYEVVLFGPLFTLAASRMFGLLFRIYALSVRRDAEGDPYMIRTLRPSIPRILRIFPVLLGLLITYRAISFDDSICKAIIHAALLHVFVATDVRSTKSMQAAAIYAATNVATLLALTIFVAFHAPQIKFLLTSRIDTTYPAWNESNNNNNTRLTSDSNPPTTDFSDYETDGSVGYRWPLFVLSILWNIFPVELITLCYRFDFARFSQRQGFELTSDSADRTTTTTGVLDKTGPTLTHDMLLDTSTPKERTKGIGPIFLAPETPDAFYNHLSPDLRLLPDSNSNLRENTTPSRTPPERTPLPISLSASTPIPFPTFLASLMAYISSTLIFSVLFYVVIEVRSEEALKYLAPLLPLVTLPLTTIAVPAVFLLSPYGGGGIMELWRYEEEWGSDPEFVNEDSNAERVADLEGGNGSD